MQTKLFKLHFPFAAWRKKEKLDKNLMAKLLVLLLLPLLCYSKPAPGATSLEDSTQSVSDSDLEPTTLSWRSDVGEDATLEPEETGLEFRTGTEPSLNEPELTTDISERYADEIPCHGPRKPTTSAQAQPLENRNQDLIGSPTEVSDEAVTDPSVLFEESQGSGHEESDVRSGLSEASESVTEAVDELNSDPVTDLIETEISARLTMEHQDRSSQKATLEDGSGDVESRTVMSSEDSTDPTPILELSSDSEGSGEAGARNSEGSGEAADDITGSDGSGDAENRNLEGSGSVSSDPELSTDPSMDSNTETSADESTESILARTAESSTDADVEEGSGFLGDSVFPSPPAVRRNFTGYRVFRVILPTQEAVDMVSKLEDEPGIELVADPKFLLRPRGIFVTSAADVMVAPDVAENVEDLFKELKLVYTVLTSDVQEAIDNENPSDPFDSEELSQRFGHSLTWERYHRLENLYSYIDFVAKRYPDIATTEVIGETHEGRPIKLLRLRGPHRENKKAIFMDAGIHAREWIGPAVITYMIKELVENPDNDCIMQAFDWYFVPVVNPDGYEFSHEKDRMWRKSRAPVRRSQAARSDSSEPFLRAAYRYGSDCSGTDLNRNFDFKWKSGGSSSKPCSSVYSGPNALSEPESQALSKAIMERKDHLAMYISLHAYSQMWLLPWGYTTEKASDHSDLFSLARIGSNALREKHGTSYLIGSIPDLLYIASGSSQDWAKGVANVKYSYTIELRDAGTYGFILPADQIIPTAEETWIGVLAAARQLAWLTYNEDSCQKI